MRGYELRDLLMKDWRVRAVFRGVFASDKLPELSSGISHAIIVNLDKSYNPGTHWCAIFISAHGDLVYFDSFGMYPYVPSVKHFITQHSRTLQYNTVPIQSLLSKTCGLYAVYFIERMCRGDNLNKIVSKFNPYSSSWNDNRIIQMYEQRLRNRFYKK